MAKKFDSPVGKNVAPGAPIKGDPTKAVKPSGTKKKVNDYPVYGGKKKK